MASEHSDLGTWAGRLRAGGVPDDGAGTVAPSELRERYPMFGDYQRATEREIPLVRLVRRPS